jgi:uncharacterized protein
MAVPTQLPDWPLAQSPFHPVELALQERFGRRQQLDAGARRAVRDHLIEQHQTFFAQLPFVLLGSVDAHGQPWASIVAGRPGFAHSPDPSTLRFDVTPLPGDPVIANLATGTPIGALGIELPTRRRNRMSGKLATLDAAGFSVRVVQSYGNCPQYIQGRDVRFLDDREMQPPIVETAAKLNDRDRRMFAAADTFYIASTNPDLRDGAGAGTDVSHRGGRPGFIRIDDDQTLTTPDFVGNYFFNTIGNLMVEPRAGLLFVDFERGDVTMLAVRAEVIWDGPDVEAFAGAQRLVRFHITEIVRLPAALPFRATGETSYAREIAATGIWAEAEQSKTAQRDQSRWRTFRVIATRDESRSIRSYLLEPADNDGVAPHRAGQFLPIRVPAGHHGSLLIRTYSLSDVSNGRSYRISVKRDGVVSAWLHEHAAAGATIEALPPRGAFVLDEASHRPILFLSAGVGVTPMIAMLNSLLVNDMRTRRAAPIVWIQAARNGTDLAFAAHVRHKARHHGNFTPHIVLSAPTPDDMAAGRHDSVGRIDRKLLAWFSLTPDVDAYLCGPPGFMAAGYAALRELGVPDAQIRFEAFGPASIVRQQEGGAEATGAGPLITFVRSKVRAAWRPAFPSLLAAADAAGVRVPYSCKSGICGSCAVRLLKGAITYNSPPVADRAPDEILLCCALPEASDEIVIDA